MIRLSLLIISLFSLIYGLYFLFFPFNFATITNANYDNIAWLRNIGASITGLLFLGLLFIYINPKKTYKLLIIVTITSILQTTALVYSRANNEFTAKNIMLIDLTIYSAIIVTVYLIFVVIKYKKKFN